jgi:hypothetical protein
MSLISRVEITNYLTEGLEVNHFANWDPMLMGITLRMDCQSSLVNITNGGGKTSIAEVLLYLLSRDSKLFRRVREKAAPKGRGYTHARIEFREVNPNSYGQPGLLQLDTDNLPGATRVIGVMFNLEVAESPIFYSYSGTLEDSPCYIKTNGMLMSVPDDAFIKRTKQISGNNWNIVRVNEWQEHVGLLLSMDVIRRNAIYQTKGSDDKNASFFSFKVRPGETYDGAFFKFVIAPDLLTNLLNTFSEDGEVGIGDTLHNSLSQIVNSEREMSRKKANLEQRESAITVDLKPVVDAAGKANSAGEKLQTALRVVKKDVALLHHFGSQDSANVVLGLPRPIRSLVRLSEQDARIHKALKGMVIQRDDGIVIVDKTLAELAGIDVRVITQISDRKKISSSSLNSHVIDFACDFENLTSNPVKGGHYRKGYTRQAVSALLQLFGETGGATLEGLEDVIESAFDIAKSHIDTNPASLKIQGLQATLAGNAKTLTLLKKQSEELSKVIENIEGQINSRAENEAAWNKFSAIAGYLPDELRSQPRRAKGWLADEVKQAQAQLEGMSIKKGELTEGWTRYIKGLDEAGLAGIDGIRQQHDGLAGLQKKITAQVKKFEVLVRESRNSEPALRRAVVSAETLLTQSDGVLSRLSDLKKSFDVFQSYFGVVSPLETEHPSATLKIVSRRKNDAEIALNSASSEFKVLADFKAGALRFNEIFGTDSDALTLDPVTDHRKWKEAENLALTSLSLLEYEFTALQSFKAKFPAQEPLDWLAATDRRRTELDGNKRELETQVAATGVEIDALDRLAVVDDAVFDMAWKLLGDGPKRLYVTLQSMDGTVDRRIGALSALTGLLSAPVFDSLDELSKAAELLEQHDIGIPLLLKEPLLNAIGSQGDLSGELSVMNFFAGRYSRQARILLDPDYAKSQRARLVERKDDFTKQLEDLGRELELVDFRSLDYVMATTAEKAIKSNCANRYASYESELKVAQAALHKLDPQIKPDAITCLDARRNYLKRGGDARQSLLLEECGDCREKIRIIESELNIVEKRSSPESINAYLDARKYATEGADLALEKVKQTWNKASSDLEHAKWLLKNQQEALSGYEGGLDQAIDNRNKFEDEDGSNRVGQMELILKFSKQVEDVEFMQKFDSAKKSVSDQQARFIGFQSDVNFDKAAAYFDNLDKSDADLVVSVSAKKAELGDINGWIGELDGQNKRIANAEIPSWANLRIAIHEFAYEIGSQAATTKNAHTELKSLDEGVYPVEAHPLYGALTLLSQRLKSPSIDETAELSSMIAEVQAEVQSINPKTNLDTFNEQRKAYNSAMTDYSQKNKAFCEKSRQDTGKKMAAFNALELDEIERATPQHISVLLALFERLNVSLEKDREDAHKAIQAAQNANEEALTQLSRLIEVAQDNLDALKKVMRKYPNGCFKIKVTLASEVQIKEILSELTSGIKAISARADESVKALRKSDDGRIKDFLRETLIDKVFLEPSVTFIHPGIRVNEARVTDKLSTGQKVALEFMWIVRQAEYEIERGMRELSTKQAERKRQETNRVIFVDGIFSTLSDRNIIREAFSGLGNLGGNFQIIGFLHSPTWANDTSFFPTYHVGKKMTNSTGSNLIKFSESGRSAGTLGFFTSITQPNAIPV